jgi:hypothetical protein
LSTILYFPGGTRVVKAPLVMTAPSRTSASSEDTKVMAPVLTGCPFVYLHAGEERIIDCHERLVAGTHWFCSTFKAAQLRRQQKTPGAAQRSQTGFKQSTSRRIAFNQADDHVGVCIDHGSPHSLRSSWIWAAMSSAVRKRAALPKKSNIETGVEVLCVMTNSAAPSTSGSCPLGMNV